MKRLRLNAVSPTRDDATSGQKSPRKKPLTRTVWMAPALGVALAAVMLALFSIVDLSHGQTLSTTTVQSTGASTLQTVAQFSQALMSFLPELPIDPTTDPPGNFTNVIPPGLRPGQNKSCPGELAQWNRLPDRRYDRASERGFYRRWRLHDLYRSRVLNRQ